MRNRPLILLLIGLLGPLATLGGGAEEAFLRRTYGAAFDEWAAVTPAIVPRWSRWRPPSLPFCWRSVLRREYVGFLAICLTFAGTDFALDWLVEGRPRWDLGWAIVSLIGVLTYAVLRTLRRHTHLLAVEGR